MNALIAEWRKIGVALGILPQDAAHPAPGQETAAAILLALDEVARLCILMALSAIGLGTKLADMRKTGAKPFIVGFCVAATTSAVSLGLILLFALGGSV